jgi:hypothetical protein
MFEFASLKLKDKQMTQLVSALEDAGMKVSRTSGKHHLKIVNPRTKKVAFIGSQSLGDFRAGKNILRDLRRIGFKTDIKI